MTRTGVRDSSQGSEGSGDQEHLSSAKAAAAPDPEKKYCTLGCTGPWHRPECALAGHVRYTK